MKNKIKKIIVMCLLLSICNVFLGCWDYSEMNELEYVAGMAIDKDKINDEYIVTFELLDASVSGNNINSNIVESRGKTIHAAFRNTIKKTGKLLQLSHAKVFIISKDIAMEGIIPVMDLINRDSEARNDMWILISKMGTAADILDKNKKQDEIISYDLASALRNNNKVTQYKSVEGFRLINNISTKGIAATAPMVSISSEGGATTFSVLNTAIFKGDKLVGELGNKETLLFKILTDKRPNFVIPITVEKDKNISLEVLSSKKKVKTSLVDNKIVVNLNLELNTSLSELAETGVNYIKKPERDNLEYACEKYLEKETKRLLEQLQKKYKSDVIGLGYIVKRYMPKEWEKYKDNWDEAFEDMIINVNFNVNMKYSGLTNKNITIGD